MYLRTSETAPPYRPGMDRQSLYKGAWRRYWREFRDIYSERFAPLYGDLSDEKTSEVLKLLSCGDYRNGFRKHICPECGTVLMVPFYLPDKRRETIRYYGIYAHGIKK